MGTRCRKIHGVQGVVREGLGYVGFRGVYVCECVGACARTLGRLRYVCVGSRPLLRAPGRRDGSRRRVLATAPQRGDEEGAPSGGAG